jgi:hypothetical protein
LNNCVLCVNISDAMERLTHGRIDRVGKIEEERFDPRSVGIATTTFYKNWRPVSEGQIRQVNDIDGIRGDLALATIAESVRKGFQVVVVDAPVSSDAFKNRLSGLAQENPDLHVFQETEKGMSPGRRQAFREVSALQGVKAIVWTEPEKVSIARDCLPMAVTPILEGRADIVVPTRDEAALATYPDYQAEWEKRANAKFNKILKEYSLLPEEAEDLDVWFGPRIIKNDPEVTKLFLHPWEIGWHNDPEFAKKYDPELWPNATFLPVVAALWRDKHLSRPPSAVGLPVHYRHPDEQTKSEQDNDVMRAKREQQFENIIDAEEALILVFEHDVSSGRNLYLENLTTI